MKYIQDPIDELPTPINGRNPQGGEGRGEENEEIQERRSWSRNPALDEAMQPKIMEDNRAERFIAAFQQERRPPIVDGSHHQTAYSPETPQSLHLNTTSRSYAAPLSPVRVRPTKRGLKVAGGALTQAHQKRRPPSMLTEPPESTSGLPRTIDQHRTRGGNLAGGRRKSGNTRHKI